MLGGRTDPKTSLLKISYSLLARANFVLEKLVYNKASGCHRLRGVLGLMDAKKTCNAFPTAGIWKKQDKKDKDKEICFIFL